MSWSLSKTGRAGALGEAISKAFADVVGCPKGTAEDSAKIALGPVAEALCKSMPPNKIVQIDASGSAWNQQDGTALSQSLQFKLITLGAFVE